MLNNGYTAGYEKFQRPVPFKFYSILMIIFISFVFVSFTGCGNGNESKISYSRPGTVYPYFENQKYTGQTKIEECNVKAYLETENGLIDISPDRVPRGATFVNTETLLIPSINREREDEDEKEQDPGGKSGINAKRGGNPDLILPQRTQRVHRNPESSTSTSPAVKNDKMSEENKNDRPQWQMYQELLLAGGAPGYANLYSGQSDEEGFLHHHAYAPYTLGEILPSDAAMYLDVFSRHPVNFPNPCQTTMEYILETPWGRIENLTYEYRSWTEEDPEGNIRYLYEFACIYNGEERWRTGPQSGWITEWIPHVGFAYPVPGRYMHKIKRDGTLIFQRSYVQRKIAFREFEEMEFVLGESVEFNNSMLWNTSHESPLVGIWPSVDEDPRWIITIEDPDGNKIYSSGEISGVHLALNWDSGQYGVAATSTFPLHKYKGRKALMVPSGSKRLRAEASLLSGECPIIFTFSAHVIANSYIPEDTLPPTLVTYHGTKTQPITAKVPIDVRKIFVDGNVKLLDEKNDEIKASKNNPQYSEDASGNIIRNEPSAVIINDKNAKARVTYFPKNAPIPSRYIIWGKIKMNDSRDPPSSEDFRMIYSASPIEFARTNAEVSFDYGEKANTFTIPASIQKIDGIKWYCLKIRYDGTPGRAYFFEETDSKVFALLNKPLDPQKKPRVDVLDIACEIAEGEKHDEYAKMIMVEGLYKYMNKIRVKYYGGTFHFDFDKAEFSFSQFYKDEEGNCEDASCLFQICCNALGIDMNLNKLTSKDKPPAFCTYPVMPFGFSEFKEYDIPMHQVCVMKHYVYDPTYKYEFIPQFVNGILRKWDYIDHLVKIGNVEWRPLDYSVKKVK